MKLYQRDVLMGLALASCTSTPPTSLRAPPAGKERVAIKQPTTSWLALDRAKAGTAWTKAVTARVERIGEGTKALWERSRSGRLNAQADAALAASTGSFDLIGLSTMYNGESLAGISCRVPLNGMSYRAPLQSANISLGHMLVVTEEQKASQRMEQALVAYAVEYNRELVSHPSFPYADLCSASRPGEPLEELSFDKPRGFSAWNGQPLSKTLNLAQAARQGTMNEVRRWLGSGANIDQPDDFGLSPLAWAVIRSRYDVIDDLLAAGADPLEGAGRGNEMPGMPLKLALLMQDKVTLTKFLTDSTLSRLGAWPSALIEAAVRGDHVNLLARMLREEHEHVITSNLMNIARERGSTEMFSVLSAGSSDAAEAMLELAISTGDPTLLGKAISASANVNGVEGRRRSPLGNAVLYGGVATDRLVALLLEHGARPDSPAEWENSHESGSLPPTALVALVATANRLARSSGPDEVGKRTTEAQSRTLDILLQAGASTKMNDAHGRPVAVLAVTGQYDPRGLITRQELPPSWLRRLVAAGMDINATWLGSSALDWLDMMGMSDTNTAKEVTALGGKRITKAPGQKSSTF